MYYYAIDFCAFVHSMLFLNLMTKRLESPNTHYKFHIIINISNIIISWLKHQAELDISVQFVMPQ